MLYNFKFKDTEYVNYDKESIERLLNEGKITQDCYDGVINSELKKEKSEKNNELILSATVEVDGLVFKANDKSITRMLASINAMERNGKTGTTWMLADGRKVVITLEQLKQAQDKAIVAIGDILLK